MKIVELQQNSPEWLQWRKTGFSASEAPAVMGESKYFPKTPFQLYQVHTGQKEVVFTKAMEDGHTYEDRGIAAALIETGHLYKPTCGENGRFIASFDGYSDTAQIKVCEVKTTTEGSDLWKNWKKHYKWQLVHQALVADVEKVLMVVYAKDTGASLIEVFEVTQDDKEKLTAAWLDFAECMDNFIPPALHKTADYREIESDEWCGLASEYKSLSETEENIKKRKAEIKKRLVDLADGSPAKGSGISVYYSTRKGSIDYAKVPELAGVDLEPYRKKASSFWAVR